MGSGSFQGILKKMADHLAPHMFFTVSDIFTAQNNPPFIYIKVSRNGVEECGFSGAVTANDGGEVTFRKSKAYFIEGLFLVDGSGVKGF